MGKPDQPTESFKEFAQASDRRFKSILNLSTLFGGGLGLSAGLSVAGYAIFSTGIPFLGLHSIGVATAGLYGFAKFGVGLLTILGCGVPPILIGLLAGAIIGVLVGLITATVVESKRALKYRVVDEDGDIIDGFGKPRGNISDNYEKNKTPTERVAHQIRKPKVTPELIERAKKTYAERASQSQSQGSVTEFKGSLFPADTASVTSILETAETALKV